jgi:hypothetical protein
VTDPDTTCDVGLTLAEVPRPVALADVSSLYRAAYDLQVITSWSAETWARVIQMVAGLLPADTADAIAFVKRHHYNALRLACAVATVTAASTRPAGTPAPVFTLAGARYVAHQKPGGGYQLERLRE